MTSVSSSASGSLTTWTTRRVIFGTLVVLTVVIAFIVLYRFRMTLIIIFAGIALGIAIAPLVDWLHRHRLPRSLGVILIYLVLLTLLIGFAILIVPRIVEQISMALPRLASYYKDLRSALTDSSYPLIREFATRLPLTTDLLPTILAPAAEAATLDTVTQTLTIVGSFMSALFTLCAILLIGFYWTLEGELITRSLLISVPNDKRDAVSEIIENVKTRVGGYIRGQGILAATVSVASLVIYVLIGLPYALVVALLAGLFEIVPVIGPMLAAIPAVLVALVSDPSKVVWVIAASALIQFVENNLLAPRIMHKTVGVNPIVTLLAIVAFGAFLGFAGLLLAIPLAAIIQVFLDRSLLRPEGVALEEPAGRDRLSKLRYDTQELVLDVRKLARHKYPNDNRNGRDAIEDAIESIAIDLDYVLTQAVQPEDKA